MAAISPVPQEARPYQGECAGLMTRVLASAVDALVCAAALVLGYLGYNVLRLIVNPRTFEWSSTPVFLSVVTAMVFSALYLAASWAASGRTYGCHVMGLRVVGHDGGRVRLPVALLRAVLCVVLPVGLLLCAGGRSRRSLADIVFRTAVVYDWSPRRATGLVAPGEADVIAPADAERAGTRRRRTAPPV